MSILKKIIYILLLCVVQQNILAQDKTLLRVKLTPYQREAIFHSTDNKVGYTIKLKNEVKDTQRGNYYFDVKNDSGISVFHDNGGFAITERSSFKKEINLDKAQLKPSCYEVTLSLQTNYYKDTIKHFFCYEPEVTAFTDSTRPTDFFDFWEEAKRELVNTNPDFRVVPRSDMSDKFADVYSVQFYSVENIIIRGWLSVPKERGKFPVIYHLFDLNQPCYPDKQREVATFTIDVRGSGMSADVLKLNPDDYLIKNSDYKRRFILRNVYLDCLRGLDFIYRHSNLKLDTAHVAVMGVGQSAAMAIATTVLDGRPKGVSIERPSTVDIPNLLKDAEQNITEASPGNTIKNYLSNPYAKTSREAFENTWSYFDPLAFASLVRCKFIVGLTLRSPDASPKCIYHFINKLTIGRRDIYVCPSCNNEMNSAFIDLQKIWLHEVF